MNSIEIGELIAKARREAKYTQKSLAEALYITDKAISKWERGLCLPDALLWTKISMLLDLDIEHLISSNISYDKHTWTGELRGDNLCGTVAGKPLIHYLLSYFMLVGITNIAILTKDRDYIRSLKLEQYGLNISFFKFDSSKKMVVYDKFLLFGVNLTRQLQNCILSEQNISLTLSGERVPIIFLHTDCDNISPNVDEFEVKSLARGIICIPLENEKQISDASSFVHMYEKYQKTRISDLNEIARLRGLV